MAQMKDTGERITYENGAQREPHQGKGRYDWITPFGWERLRTVGGEVCDPLAESLDDYEIKEIECANVVLNQWRMGHREIDFLACAAWRVAAAIYHQETGQPCPTGTEYSPNPYALKRLADWYEAGGIKYKERGERNWEKGMPYDHPVDSGLRHINKWRMGMTDEDHLSAALWNLFAIMHYEQCHMDWFDNIPRYLEARASTNENRDDLQMKAFFDNTIDAFCQTYKIPKDLIKDVTDLKPKTPLETPWETFGAVMDEAGITRNTILSRLFVEGKMTANMVRRASGLQELDNQLSKAGRISADSITSGCKLTPDMINPTALASTVITKEKLADNTITPARFQHVLSLDKIRELEDGTPVWVEVKRPTRAVVSGVHEKHGKLLTSGKNAGCWMIGYDVSDLIRVWALPIEPTKEEREAIPWEK